MSDFIEWLSVNCDFSDASLSECISRLGPSFVYTVYCGQRAFEQIRAFARHMDHTSPLASQLNVCVEPLAEADEWVVVANGKRVGSHGIP